MHDAVPTRYSLATLHVLKDNGRCFRAGAMRGNRTPRSSCDDRWGMAGLTHAETQQTDLIACPKCDALYHEVTPDDDDRAICSRCGTTLFAPRQGSMLTVFAYALTVLVLLFAAVWFPFISIDKSGLHNTSSIFDVALSFSSAAMVPLTIAVGGMILFLPALRVMLILYVLAPLLADKPPLPQAALSFRLSEQLRPWAMVEIFILGVAVALVKVHSLAHVTPGPAFWMFVVLALIATMQDRAACSLSIWKALERR